MALGTGAVKITPAHDPNDFDCGKRHGLDFITVFDDDGLMNDKAGPFQGQHRFKARTAHCKPCLGLMCCMTRQAAHCKRRLVLTQGMMGQADSDVSGRVEQLLDAVQVLCRRGHAVPDS
jgi:hypothetical protein